MPAEERGELELLIQQHGTRVRDDFATHDLAIYVRSLILLSSGQRSFSAVTGDTHLYRELGWTGETVARFRSILETVFRVELPQWGFLSARTVADVTGLLVRALERERRVRRSTSAA